MTNRLVDRFRIASRRQVPSDVASPDDLTLDWVSADHRPTLPTGALAYCADLANNTVVFTHHDASDLARLFDAPFLFVEQLRLARGASTIPFERLDELGLARRTHRPTLVFSPGRTGSTLLVKLLAAVGVGCASEPDMLTQIGRLHPRRWEGLPPDTDARLAGACIGALCQALGPRAVIKLRGWCNARPIPMVKSVAGCRAIFMLRGMSGWALSRHRVFQETAQAVAAELHRALDALDQLAGAGIPLEILWYEALTADPAAALERLLPEGVPVGRIARVMLADSQEGTWIARAAVADRPVRDGFIREFAQAWRSERAGSSWSVDTETLLARMWDS